MTESQRYVFEEDKEEEEEQFFESLDRIVSCSSSSCSSDNEDGYQRNSDYALPSPVQVPPPIRFPMATVSVYDAWIADPSPVHERRRRLLAQLGLASDKTLSRIGSDTTDGVDTASDRRSEFSDPAEDQQRDSSSDSRPFSQVYNKPQIATHEVLPKQGSGNGSSSAPSKPPSGKFCRRSGEIKTSERSTSNAPFSATTATNGSYHQPEQGGDCDGASRVVTDRGVCTIKNLNNGEEFVVNEMGKDGVWKKLRVVATGRQLTREEFETAVVGHSPIVQELMRRQNVEESYKDDANPVAGNSAAGPKSKKKGGWLKSIRNVASSVTEHYRARRSDERDASSERGRRSSSATDDSQDNLLNTPERTKVRHYGKSCKELSALYMGQEIQAHNGSIWTIKFSLEGKYLASAGADRVIHIWQVIESERRSELVTERVVEGSSNPSQVASGSPETGLLSANGDCSHLEKKKPGRLSYSRKSANMDHVVVPEYVFSLSEKPVYSLQGHLADVLDLSWSKSEYLLSSSMDKTVRLWHTASRSCLKIFSHSDYVTCIQFNPVDDKYFISGSLDAKVRIWSIPDRKVVDWNDIHEMVTAASYTPDGQGALVGSHKGCCHLYSTSDNKLYLKSQINLQNKKRKSHAKKITGFQFTPRSSSEVLVTSADSQIRVVDGVDLVHKFKGFRNTSSQISAALTTDGKHVVCASEDSHVYVWRHDCDSRPSRGKGVNTTTSYEYFHCQDVSVAIPWPGCGIFCPQDSCCNGEENQRGGTRSLESAEVNGHQGPLSGQGRDRSPLHPTWLEKNSCNFSDRFSLTWPEEKLLVPTTTTNKLAPHNNGASYSGTSAWGMVIVTAGLGGEIKTFQNFGLPVRI